MPVKIVKKKPVNTPIASVELSSDMFYDRGVRLYSQPNDATCGFRMTTVDPIFHEGVTVNITAKSVREFAKALLEMVGD